MYCSVIVTFLGKLRKHPQLSGRAQKRLFDRFRLKDDGDPKRYEKTQR